GVDPSTEVPLFDGVGVALPVGVVVALPFGVAVAASPGVVPPAPDVAVAPPPGLPPPEPGVALVTGVGGGAGNSQLAGHASPPRVLPSSHSSPGSTVPSPQRSRPAARSTSVSLPTVPPLADQTAFQTPPAVASCGPR